MKFSIITINYNNYLGLKKTMQSVFHQSWKDFEYIIIDGGSTDGSKEFIELNSDKINYWISEPDNGIYHAMNKGIALAKGDYLLFLNSGDYLVDSMVLHRVVKEKFNADIIYGNLLKGDHNYYTIDKGFASNEVSFLQLYNSSINHPASFIKKIIFKDFGLYNENLKIVSDWDFFFKVVIFHDVKVKYIDVNISFFDQKGISSTQFDLIKEERFKVIRSYLPDLVIKDIEYYSSWKADLIILEQIFKFPFLKKLFRGIGFFLKRI